MAKLGWPEEATSCDRKVNFAIVVVAWKFAFVPRKVPPEPEAQRLRPNEPQFVDPIAAPKPPLRSSECCLT